MQSRRKTEQPLMEHYKIVVVGEWGSGSTNLTVQTLHMLSEGSKEKKLLDPTNMQNNRFIFSMEVNGKECTVELLDIGQLVHSAILDTFFKEGDGYLLVFNVYNRFSFQAVEYFIEKIRRAKDRDLVPMVLVANRMAQQTEAQEEEVPSEEASDLAFRYGIPYLETESSAGRGLKESVLILITQIRLQTRIANNVQKSSSPAREPAKLHKKLQEKMWNSWKRIHKKFSELSHHTEES